MNKGGRGREKEVEVSVVRSSTSLSLLHLLVIIQDGVHVLDPDRVHWSIEDNPLAVLIHGRGLFLEGRGQYSIRPLV